MEKSHPGRRSSRSRDALASTRDARATHAPQNRDENTDYYVAKLDELVKKFGGLGAAAAKSEAKQASLAL
ncbi:MAG: hypothetical protein H0V56_02380 [Chthoniobacterales bacterium]|nr:hypothetical protein [Chthoniobacterales bacterium]